ncbi:MAG TPA: FHA domain-containing protein [Planctomycetota bacterium]|nr:FHA domain-containing protein [Planctomycetota bacterium]
MASGILQLLTGEYAGQSFLLDGTVLIGRDAGSHIRINDKSISRKHAQIEERPDGYRLVDLGSQNGTLLDGAPVKEAMLTGACRLVFGKIEADFSLVESGLPAAVPAKHGKSANGDADWQSLPAGPASLDDIFVPPKSLDEIDKRDAEKKSLARHKLQDLLFVGLLVLMLAIGAVVFLSIGKESRIPTIDIVLARGESKLVPFQGLGGDAQVSGHEQVATIERDEEYRWLLSITGSDIGEARAGIYSGGSRVGTLNIVVKGSKPKEQFTEQLRGLSEEERITMAESLVAQGESMETDSMWNALQMYRRAETVCRAIPGAPPVRMLAAKKARTVKEKIDKRANELMDEARAARKSRRIIDAARTLNEVRSLIPDPSDKRHQRVTIILYSEYPELMRPSIKK